MKQNLIIDGQILQTDAWYRGMGKYTLQVLSALSQSAAGDTEVSIIFNDNIECDAKRFETVKFLCPNAQQIHCKLPTPENKKIQPKDYIRRLDACINKNFDGQKNHFLITSLFFFDFFAEFPDNCHKLLLFYDLTPILFWQDLGGYFPPDLYMERFKKVLEAEHIFSISETTKDDLLKLFGLPPKSVTNINGGFTKISELTKKPETFDVPAKYILYPTGDLPHKNNEVAVRGFEKFRGQDSEIFLLITSHFQEASAKRLATISPNVIFTGNVSDEELEWLYENASCVLFASKYEGLGMPILDAVANNRPVVTSNIPVFKEMSKNAFYYFDPNEPNELASALQSALQEDVDSKSSYYSKVMEKYTWPKTADAILEHLSLESAPSTNAPKANINRPRVAVVCLHPGIAQQIGRQAEPLHTCLCKLFKVDYYFDGNGFHYRDMERPTFLDYIDGKTLDISKLNLTTYKKYDSIIYLLDSAAFPSRAAQRACVLPGIALVGGFTGLNEQRELLKTLAIKNQRCAIDLGDMTYDGYSQLVSKIDAYVKKQKAYPSLAEKAIRKGGTNRRIIRRLKRLPRT